MKLFTGIIFTLMAANNQAPAADVTVTTDFSRSFSIMGEQHLDRKTYFNVHGNLGEQPNAWMEEQIITNYNWIPCRGFLQTQNAPEDPNHPGYTDPDYWMNEELKNDDFQTGATRFPNLNHPQVWVNQPARFPEYMGEYLYHGETNLLDGYLTPTNADAYADISMHAISNLVQNGSPIPAYFEFRNETDCLSNWGYLWAPSSYDLIREYSNVMAEKLHNAFPGIKVCAPSYAWPYMELNNFNNWETKFAKFAYSTEDKIDYYTIHLFERDYSSRNGIFSQYAAQYQTDNFIFSRGKLRAHLDFIDNYRYKNDQTLPGYMFTACASLIYSNTAEYPRNNDINAWNDSDFFNASKSLSSMILQLMERPDRTEKFIPFMEMAGNQMGTWAQDYPWVLFATDQFGSSNQADYVETEFVNFLNMWRDIEGDYLYCHSSDQDKVLSKAFFTNNTAYIVAQNMFSNNVCVNFSNLLGNNTISSIDRKRYRMNSEGSVLFYDWYPVTFDITDVSLLPDELFILRVNLNSKISFTEPSIDEKVYYATKYMQSIVYDTERSFGFTLPNPLPSTEYAYLDLGLARDGGFQNDPWVRLNHTTNTLPNADLSRSIGITNYWKTTRIPISISDLTNGYNSVQVEFPHSGGYITSCKIVLGETD